MEFALPEQAIVGLDWAAFQLYALHDDAEAATAMRPMSRAGEGAWDGHLRRSRRALGRGPSAGQLVARVQRVETEFDSIIVRAELDRHTRPDTPGKRIDYSRFTATIVDRQTGARRGFVRWFDTAQVLTWKIEGGSQGVILPDRTPWRLDLHADHGVGQRAGVPVRDPGREDARARQSHLLVWLARRWAGRARRRRSCSWRGPWRRCPRPHSRCREPRFALSCPTCRRSMAGGCADGRSALAVRTTVVNEPGCDNLHWLDGSIFRACCDQHDRCYETNGCSASSWWWPFAGSWSCERCNVQVAYCFCTLSNPAYCGGAAVGPSNGSGGASGGGCTSVAGGFCPIECQTCQAR